MQEFLSLFNVPLLSATLRVSTALILASLGYVICIQAGVVDMGLEGKLLLGAFLSVYITGTIAITVFNKIHLAQTDYHKSRNTCADYI